MKIGVYICHCGTNIAKTVDVEKVAGTVGKHPRVKVSKHYEYMCSEPGQQLIKDDIRREKLDRIVVASCSPRMHEPTFRNVVEEAGLNPYCFEMVNIREQCSWVHEEKEEATRKALELILAGVSRAVELESLERKEISVIPQAAVIGGGIAGMQAALDIADRGFKVYLVERSPSIGGRMAQLDKTFPTLDCSACILTPKMVDVKWHPNIELLTYSEVEGVEGYVGNFRVKVNKKPRYVDLEKCTGCGECTDVCSVELPNEFDFGLSSRKAIYMPFPQAVPPKYTIDKRGLQPCRDACPAGVGAPGYVMLASRGKFYEALQVIKEKLPFPSICGRVCHRPCEKACTRKDIDEPLGIAHIKRFVGDLELKSPTAEFPPIKTRAENVAIVGGGPAGLTAAHDLAMKGYHITIYESAPVLGGMMRFGIPTFRLPKEILEREISDILALRVKVHLNTTIGKNLIIKDLFDRGYKAIFLAVGAQKGRKMDVPGEELEGVLQATEFLKELNLGETPKLGDKVIVVGGGNAALDTARSALRLGAKEVIIMYRRSRVEMPAEPEWEIDETKREGVKFVYLTTPTKVIGENEHIKAIECVKMKLTEPDETGRRKVRPIPGSEFMMEADNLILAIGQEVDLSFLTKDINLECNPWRTVKVDPVSLATNIEGVFCGGDAVLGAGTVIEAIAAGKEAAISIDRYINGKNLKEGRGIKPKIAEVSLEGVKKERKVPMRYLPIEERKNNFREVELGYTEEEVIKEAKRCLQCGGCSECLECEKACEAKAIVHNQKEESIELEVGAIVVATGFDQFDSSKLPEYGYGKYSGVITGLEFERLSSASGPTNGKIEINGKEPKRVAFISCVGSRKKETNSYCSRVCCMYTAKQAHLVKEKLPEAEVTVYYTDARTFGKGYEEFYDRVKAEGVKYKRRELDDEIRVSKKSDKLVVEAKPHEPEEVDLVVLASAIVPSSGTSELARILNISQGPDGFFLEAHPKLRPVDTFSDGIFLAGCNQSPKDIPDTVAQASASAAEVCSLLTKGKVMTEGIVASVDENLCTGCGFCAEVCPINAIELETVEKKGAISKLAKVNEALCKGCGICSAACLSGAIQQRHFEDKQVLPLIDALGEQS